MIRISRNSTSNAVLILVTFRIPSPELSPPTDMRRTSIGDHDKGSGLKSVARGSAGVRDGAKKTNFV